MHRDHSQRRRGARVSLAAVTAAAMTFSLVGGAVAQEVGEAPAPGHAAGGPADVYGLIERMGELGQQVAAKNEELKAAEDELARAEAELEGLRSKAEQARRDLEAATSALDEQQRSVNGIAQSRYRGFNFDPLTTTLASGDPQSAVDRLGYLGAISRDAQRTLETMSARSAEAEAMRDTADRAVKLAADKAAELEARREQLVLDRQALEAQQADIEAQVDGLSPEQRAAWEDQFNASSARFDPAKLAELSGLGGGAVAAAMSRIGSPYGWGATGPNQFDCSGLMVWSYAQQGKTIPRTSQAQLAGGTPVPLDQLQPGDIVGYFPGVTHVGMYIGDGQVVHASTYGVPVQVVPLHSMQVVGAVRY
ncbi:C40 family peptidase [Corynebacterium endometrii]|uniref:Putative endopeptidase n=1 Tax=Corynebacterium endometrii TaxID=2488819 RepID=A0A4P7QGH2_9CORY|nr:C40 family peptidase [Corynebacterium endometrii]QCB28825.1 putative endopeptidase precursor [Corynebacterium endometrii]